jgi:hypothetical protein
MGAMEIHGCEGKPRELLNDPPLGERVLHQLGSRVIKPYI